MYRSLSQGEGGGHAHERAARRRTSLQAISPAPERRYTAPPPDLTRRQRVRNGASLLWDAPATRNLASSPWRWHSCTSVALRRSGWTRFARRPGPVRAASVIRSEWNGAAPVRIGGND